MHLRRHAQYASTLIYMPINNSIIIMIQIVEKRDGRVVGYNEEKIKAAIRKAMLTTEMGEDEALVQKITDRVGMSGKGPHDCRRNSRSRGDRTDEVGKKGRGKTVYSISRPAVYRPQGKTRDMFLEIIEAKNNDITRENANMNTDSPAGMMMKFASETTKPFVDDYLLSPDVKGCCQKQLSAHTRQRLLPYKSLTCVQHPLDRILKKGFVAGHGESRPAKRIETASIIGCISLETAQNEMHGGQAIPAFDFYLAPFVRSSFIEEIKNLEHFSGQDLHHLYNKEIKDFLRKDLENLTGEDRLLQHAVNKTVERVHQAMEAFIHNMNTIHSRGGNQVVFSSINYGTDTSAEGRCVIREILNSTYEGVGERCYCNLPHTDLEKKRGVSYLPEDPNYDLYKLACKVTARRFFPNFVNLDASFNQHEKWRADDPERYKYEVATMGCRTRVFENRYGEKTSIGRGNISFSTINIVRIAIELMGIREKRKESNVSSKSLMKSLTSPLSSLTNVSISKKQLLPSNSRLS